MLLKVIFLVAMTAFVVVLMLLYGALMLLIELLSSESVPEIKKIQLKTTGRRAARLIDRSKKWLDSKENRAKEVT